MELSDDIYEQVLELCDDGDFLIEQEEYNQAINKYKAALELMPDSKYEWEASTWIYVAMGDAYYYGENYEEALNSLIEGTKCPDGFGNAFILLRMGQCYYMLDDISKAKEYLLEAYMLQGEEIFEDESEREMWAGRVAYELGDEKKALEYISLANKKSKGRCFGDNDEKYKEFWKKHILSI